MESTETAKTAKTRIIKFRDAKGKTYDSLYIDSVSGRFYARKQINGRSHFVALKTKVLSVARAKLYDALSEKSVAFRAQYGNQATLFKDYYHLLLKEKIALNISQATLVRIQSIWENSLRPFWELVRPQDLNQDLINDYLIWYKRKFPNQGTFNQLKYLRNLINMMDHDGVLPKGRKLVVRMPLSDKATYDKQKGRFITEVEFNLILRSSDERLRLFIILAYTTGMRISEICNLKVENIKFKDGHYIALLENTKTRTERQIPFPSILNEELEKWLINKTTWVFPCPTNANKPVYSQLLDKSWVRAKKEAGMTKERIRFHDLRHTAATNMARCRINPSTACSVLGMSLAVYQKCYLKLTPEHLTFIPDELASLVNI